MLFLIGYLVLLSAGFALLEWFIYVPSVENNNLLRTTCNMYMLICILLSICLFFFTVRSSFMKKLVVIVMLIHYAAALYTLGSAIVDVINNLHGDMQPLMMYYNSLPTNIGLLTISFPFVYLFLRREIQFGLSYMENSTLRHGCVYMMFSMLLFTACIFSLHTFAFHYGYSKTTLLFFHAAFILTDCLLYFMFFSEVRLTMKIRQSEDQLRSIDSQYRQISASISEARRARHDIRHHLNHISILNHNGEREELEAYLESYEASFHKLEQIPLCGYPAFNNILQYYIERAVKKDINVKTELRPLRESLGFDVIDITVIIGNLMENAIEACDKLPPDIHRFIRIWVKQADMVFLFEIENSCETTKDQPDFTDASHFSSTKSAISHGMGLNSIQFAAEKYGGNAEFKKSNGTFVARVVMNIP